MRAILVSVDYHDLLAITLPYNRHHFSSVCVVTAPGDKSIKVAEDNGCKIFVTSSFYDGGASFNKWKALEEGLNWFRRRDIDPWLCIMDADILWPKELRGLGGSQNGWNQGSLVPGNLYTPLRRMMVDNLSTIPQETEWRQFPVHSNIQEWAGYSQIFHQDDCHLPQPPWHETNWRHAGGADSCFQQRWPASAKLRPPWDCLHLGSAGTNWAGRVTPYVDGTTHPEAPARAATLSRFFDLRRAAKGIASKERL